MKRQQLIIVLVFLLLVFLFVQVMWGGVSSVAELKMKVENAGPWAPLLYIIVLAAEAIVPFFPGVFLTMFGGYLFGVFWGTILSLIAVAIGASIVYVFSKNIAITDWFHEHETRRLKRFLKKYQLFGVFLARMSLIFPSSLISFYAGVVRMKYWRFLLATVLGTLPVAVLFTIFGSGLTGLWEVQLWPFSAVVVVLLITFFWRRTQRE